MSFFARILEAGLLDPLKSRCFYAQHACKSGFDVAPYVSNQQQSDVDVIVGIQYMLIAGRTMAKDFLKEPISKTERKQWSRWIRRLRQIADREKAYGHHITSLAQEAYEHARSLESDVRPSASGDTDSSTLQTDDGSKTATETTVNSEESGESTGTPENGTEAKETVVHSSTPENQDPEGESGLDNVTVSTANVTAPYDDTSRGSEPLVGIAGPERESTVSESVFETDLTTKG